MDDEDQPYYSRNQAFGDGQSAGANPAMASLQQRSNQYNEAAPHSFVPMSTLNQYKMSGNGMSGNDAQRLLPGMNSVQFPTSNGASTGTLETENNLRMAGAIEL